MNTLRSDGTWPDINYQSKRRGNWDTRDHLDRIILMATAYVTPTSDYFQNIRMKEAIISGLDHWVQKDYQNPNAYNKLIGVPGRMLHAFILPGEDLPKSLSDRAMKTVRNRSRPGL